MWKLCSNFKSSSIWGNEVRNDICSSWHFYMVLIALQKKKFTDRVCDLQRWFSTDIIWQKGSHQHQVPCLSSCETSLIGWLISTLLIVFTLIVNSRYKLSFSPFCFLSQCDSPNLLLQSWYLFLKALALVRFLPTWHKIKSSRKKEYQLKNRLPQTVLKGRQICAAFSWLGLIWGAQPTVGCATPGKVWIVWEI